MPDGRLALVRGGLPGERVKTEVRERAGVLQGVVTEVVDASPRRTEPSSHPGLDYSHIGYEYQLELKRGVAEDALSRALGHKDSGKGGGVQILPVIAAPEPWGYRSAVQPAVSRNGPTGLEVRPQERCRLGYRRPQTDTFVSLTHDPAANAGPQPGMAAVWQEKGSAQRRS